MFAFIYLCLGLTLCVCMSVRESGWVWIPVCVRLILSNSDSLYLLLSESVWVFDWVSEMDCVLGYVWECGYSTSLCLCLWLTVCISMYVNQNKQRYDAFSITSYRSQHCRGCRRIFLLVHCYYRLYQVTCLDAILRPVRKSRKSPPIS